MFAALDNDVVCKGACYALLDVMVKALTSGPENAGVLGTARFVVPQKIRRISPVKGEGAALDNLADVLERCTVLDPTDSEQSLAAELELQAQMQGLALDTGESLLCAMVLDRKLSILVTGDKRAIEALEVISQSHPRIPEMARRVMCFEQTFLLVLKADEPAQIRAAVCGEPNVDRALTYCFSCSLPSLNLEDVVRGLKSYVQAIQAPRLLVV